MVWSFSSFFEGRWWTLNPKWWTKIFFWNGGSIQVACWNHPPHRVIDDIWWCFIQVGCIWCNCETMCWHRFIAFIPSKKKTGSEVGGEVSDVVGLVETDELKLGIGCGPIGNSRWIFFFFPELNATWRFIACQGEVLTIGGRCKSAM